MKLIRASKDRLLLHFGKREKQLLLAVLKLYPRIPPAHHRLSRSGRLPDAQAGQQLLNEALAEQRAQNQRQLETLLADPRRCQEDQSGCRFSLSPAEVEWLLQVLNDVRVGSWILLGSPEAHVRTVNARNAADVWAMEMAGMFQMQLLEVLQGPA